jgi:hypothetical protein
MEELNVAKRLHPVRALASRLIKRFEASRFAHSPRGSQLSREFRPETGSQVTGSSAIHVLAADPVVEQIEAESGLRLRLTLELSLKGPQATLPCCAQVVHA